MPKIAGVHTGVTLSIGYRPQEPVIYEEGDASRPTGMDCGVGVISVEFHVGTCGWHDDGRSRYVEQGTVGWFGFRFGR